MMGLELSREKGKGSLRASKLQLLKGVVTYHDKTDGSVDRRFS